MKNQKETLFNHLLPCGDSAVIYDYTHSDRSYETHAHNDLEINLITKGSAMIHLGGENYRIRTNHLIILKSLEYHKLSDRSDDFAMKVIIFPSRFLRRYLREDNFIPEILRGSSSMIRELNRDHRARVIKVIEEAARKDISANLKESLMRSLFIMLFEFYRKSRDAECAGTFPRHLITILKEVKQSGNSLSLKEASALVSMEPETISRLFKAHLHMGYNSYLNRQRLISFTDNYGSGDENLLHCALNAGFNSYRSFYRVFKKFYGMGPRAYFIQLIKTDDLPKCIEYRIKKVYSE